MKELENYLTIENKKHYLVEEWEQAGLLNGLSPRQKYVVAAVLENQLMPNMKLTDKQFKMTSIPLLRRIWSNTVIPRLVSFQTLIGDTLYYNHHNPNGKWLRTLKASPKARFVALWTEMAPNVDSAAMLVNMLAAEIGMGQTHDTLKLLRQNARHHAWWDFDASPGETIKEKFEELYSFIMDICWQCAGNLGFDISDLDNFPGFWIVTSPEVIAILNMAGFNSPEQQDFFNVEYLGKLGPIDVYKDPTGPINQILVGYKGESDLDAGLIYALDTPLLPDGSNLMTCVDTQFVENGKDFYTLITVKDIIV